MAEPTCCEICGAVLDLEDRDSLFAPISIFTHVVCIPCVDVVRVFLDKTFADPDKLAAIRRDYDEGSA